jgi:lysophospholipase L1-like esterase
MIEDPSGIALRPFFESLARVSAQEPGAKSTIVQFGDSHTAADFLTAEVRRGLQRRFGDAGRGFLLPGRAFKYYFQRDVKHGGDGPWTAQNGLRADALEPLGLGGIRMTASSPRATLYLETCSSCDTNNRVSAFEIYYWRHAGGGWFQVRIDGEPYRVVDTRTGPLAASGHGSTGYFRVEVPDGPHRLEVYPSEGTVDLFGISMERDAPGVSYDALGLNGATAAMPVRWGWELAGEQLAHRDPDLLVTWYGTNESAQPDFRASSYLDTYRALLLRLRETAPKAGCLVLGPPDRVVRARKKCPPDRSGADGPSGGVPEGCEWEPPPVLDEIVNVQRAVAFEAGCGFWDTRRVMGGAGVLELWAMMSPPLAQPDHVHLTKDGYERLGNALLTDLMTEYDRYAAKADRSR